jgi:hypothetical protein
VGIWRPIRIEAFDTVYVKYVKWNPELSGDNWSVDVEVLFECARDRFEETPFRQKSFWANFYLSKNGKNHPKSTAINLFSLALMALCKCNKIDNLSLYI